jgi:hypothetical protein
MSYTESQARLALGTELQLGQNDADDMASPPTEETFVAIGEITALGKSGAKADTPDVTNMQTPDGVREFISGLRESGEISCTVNYVVDDSSQAAVEGLFYSGERRNFRIVVPPNEGLGEVASPGFWYFKAIVNSFGDTTLSPDKQISQSFKLKVSGKYLFQDTP